MLKRLSKTRNYKKLGRYYLPYHSMTNYKKRRGCIEPHNIIYKLFKSVNLNSI
jgi:hypothetical protein